MSDPHIWRARQIMWLQDHVDAVNSTPMQKIQKILSSSVEFKIHLVCLHAKIRLSIKRLAQLMSHFYQSNRHFNKVPEWALFFKLCRKRYKVCKFWNCFIFVCSVGGLFFCVKWVQTHPESPVVIRQHRPPRLGHYNKSQLHPDFLKGLRGFPEARLMLPVGSDLMI